MPSPVPPWIRSGLYACPGASATASAAACENRLDEPMTNDSNVYFGRKLVPRSLAGARAGARCSRCDGCLVARLGCFCRIVVSDDREAHLEPLARLARRLSDQLAEVPFDPRARELVRHADLEIVASEADRAGCAEPRREHAVRKVGT